MARKKEYKTPKCRYCGSENTVRWSKRYNKSKKKHRYKCNDCSKNKGRIITFTEDDGFLRMRTKPKIICTVIDLFYRKVSLQDIKQFFR